MYGGVYAGGGGEYAGGGGAYGGGGGAYDGGGGAYDGGGGAYDGGGGGKSGGGVWGGMYDVDSAGGTYAFKALKFAAKEDKKIPRKISNFILSCFWWVIKFILFESLKMNLIKFQALK